MSINRNKIEQFMHWEGGQRLFNFAYSMGAAIVILGALFKILHLSGGNTLLMVGMGTEVLMFILTAFDRPPKEYKWENVFPELHDGKKDADTAAGEATQDDSVSGDMTAAPAGTPVSGNVTIIGGGGYASGGATVVAAAGNAAQGGVAPGNVVAGGVSVSPESAPQGGILDADDARQLGDVVRRMSEATRQMECMADMTEASRDYLVQMASISDQLKKLSETTRSLNAVSEVLLDSYRAITENSEKITGASTGYVDQMEALNRNVAGLNTIYEIQLKSVSGQLDSIDRVNRGIREIRDMYEQSAESSARYREETEKMTRYMQQLNRVYENMIHAMTVNMYRPMPGMPGMSEPPSSAAPAHD